MGRTYLGKARACATTALLVFTASVTAPALIHALPSHHALEASQHHDGAPCPDGDRHGPCAPGCPCWCCPGHAPVPYIPAAVAVTPEPAPTPYDPFTLSPLSSARLCSRVFRPPRG